MKSVFLAGSRKFYREIQEIAASLRKNEIVAELGRSGSLSKKVTLKSEKTALLSMFRKIEKSDLVYVYCSKEGYVGKTVAMEIAYAYSKKKEIMSSHKIKELSARALVTKIISPSKFLDY